MQYVLKRLLPNLYLEASKRHDFVSSKANLAEGESVGAGTGADVVF